MIIRKAQIVALNEGVVHDFQTRLRTALEGRYVHVLPRLPRSARDIVVANMLARAKAWGVTWESALVRFADLLAVSPDF